MTQKLILWTVLLALTLFSASCAAQDTANEPGDVPAVPVVSTEEGNPATETAGEAAMTPTLATEGSTAISTLPVEGAATSGADGTAVIPQTGPSEAGLPDDLDEMILVLRETGATVEFGDAVEQEAVSVPGQVLLIDGEEVQIFTYESAEQLDIQASQLADDQDPESEPHYYKLGTMLVRYVGSDPGVRDLLEDVLGAQAAGR